MSDKVNPAELILYFLGNASASVSVTKLMKLLYLSDIEHQQLYGEPLSSIDWSYHHFGPFFQGFYQEADSLQEVGLITCAPGQGYEAQGRDYAIVADARAEFQERLNSFSPQAHRVLTHVLQQFGNLSVSQIKAEAYNTITMKNAVKGGPLDLSQEPRRSAKIRVPGLAAFLAAAPAPIIRDIGDPHLSAQEDIAILQEMAGLRALANKELV